MSNVSTKIEKVKWKVPSLQELFEDNSVVFQTENGKTSAIHIEEALKCVRTWLEQKRRAKTEQWRKARTGAMQEPIMAQNNLLDELLGGIF